MQKGIIILLNGVSSAGKTTLARAIQRKAAEPYFWLANDTFYEMIPKKFWDTNQVEMKFEALELMGKTIKTFSDDGKNVVVDTVMLTAQKYDLYKYIQSLIGYRIVLVHVTCPLEEQRKREKERGDRKIGQGESQLPILNPQSGYDLTVDTYQNSADECAQIIINYLNSKQQPYAKPAEC